MCNFMHAAMGYGFARHTIHHTAFFILGKVIGCLLYTSGHHLVEKLNERFVAKQLAEYETYFDQVETKPLTENQRKACVRDEKFNLVLAGAGTGKTSTMIGRAGYLLKSGLALSLIHI